MPSSSTIILHMHGGAFITGDGRPKQLAFMCSALLRSGDVTAVFAPQYRLSSRPGSHHFPAALQDTLSSYLHLIQTLGIPANHITVSGDSAGGNLVIGLLRYLSIYGRDLGIPLPAKAVLMSPWVAPKASVGPEIVTTSNPNYKTDYLPHSHLLWGAMAYAGKASPADRFISPLGHPFPTPVPTLVTVGSDELFEADIALWAEEMDRVEGNDIWLRYEENAPHDTLLVGAMLGWVDSAEMMAHLISTFAKCEPKQT
ncbi:hypothetical protein PG991_005581 [Apiospora marii]|uniref:Alpha/beta hydrolase fold-3 domain-containing protein n=2 Tax=Apiospora marii TaxID=335849 RepID=A0ABR1S9M1_9PEZI